MKGAVDIITIIIVTCMVVSIGLMLWFYLSFYYSQVTRSGQSSTSKSLVTLSSCMRIEEASQNNFFIRNCGTGLVTNNTLNVYVDENPVSFVFRPSSLDAGKTGTLSLQGVWGLPIGQHTLRITNPNVETSALFDAELPDSCVMDLEFDEGSGTTAHDSSGNGNDGVLLNGPAWVDGKFGKALGFDGANNIINISNPNNLSSLNDKFTLEAWIKPYNASHQGFNRIIWFNNFRIDFAFTNQVNGFAVVWFIPNSTWLPGSTPLALGQWYHVAATFSANSGNVDIYVNGKNDGEYNVGHQSVTTLSGNIDIGNVNDLSRGFNGTIDSVRIYDDVLTPDQTLNFRLI